ncbi:plectin-like isoform X2 [Sipha flava]|uniref:Plectin-like isoform X2 n=1 Tax=Sipha flava TaxID=143950 RepID=A0A8B8FAS7_9HEMI|nr:plectin-like isoform X2 [Sipha flava]
MVYSSDFYTSRRPAYYKPGSSYSVTPLYSSDGYDLPPTYYKAHQVYQTCTTPTPFILTPSLSTGKPSPNVLPYNGYPYTHHQYVPLHRRSGATIHGVLDRIEHRPRSHPSYDPTDEYLNSRSSTTFNDVTRDIRAQTAGLLKQVYTPTIRPKLSSVSNGYSELPISQRIESDAYIEKILADSDSYRRDNNIGKGHLACVSYAGGKAYPRRRPHLSKEVDDNITMLSYYNKTREAAAASSSHPTNKNKLNKNEPAQTVISKNLESENESAELVRLSAAKKAAEKEAALAAKKIADELAAKEESKEVAKLAAKKEADEAAKKSAAENEAARLEAEKEEARLAAEEEAARIAAEEEAARIAAEEEAARIAAEEEAAKKIAEEEAARIAAEEEATRLAAEEEAAKLEAEEEATRLATEEKSAGLEVEEEEEEEEEVKNTRTEETQLKIKKEVEETENNLQEDSEITSKNKVEESEQQIDSIECPVKDVESYDQETNAAATEESFSTTTSTEIINEEDGGVKTTAIFQSTIKKTTTITSSTSITSENEDNIQSTVEIQEVVEEDDEDEPDSEHQDVAQAEGQESEEEDESEEEESEEE